MRLSYILLAPLMLFSSMSSSEQRSSILATIEQDFDTDGRLDKAVVHYYSILQNYGIVISLASGAEFHPLEGHYDPKVDKISLSYRNAQQGGDIRCKDWKPGVQCNLPRSSGEPDAALVLAHSSEGQFVLFYEDGWPYLSPRPKGATPPRPPQYRIMLAYNGKRE